MRREHRILLDGRRSLMARTVSSIVFIIIATILLQSTKEEHGIHPYLHFCNLTLRFASL